MGVLNSEKVPIVMYNTFGLSSSKREFAALYVTRGRWEVRDIRKEKTCLRSGPCYSVWEIIHGCLSRFTRQNVQYRNSISIEGPMRRDFPQCFRINQNIAVNWSKCLWYVWACLFCPMEKNLTPLPFPFLQEVGNYDGANECFSSPHFYPGGKTCVCVGKIKKTLSTEKPKSLSKSFFKNIYRSVDFGDIVVTCPMVNRWTLDDFSSLLHSQVNHEKKGKRVEGVVQLS